MTETAQALGRKVVGEVNQYTTNPVEQIPAQEFLAALDALVGHPDVEEVLWEQWTPYFNDGEACEFIVGDPYVKIKNLDENWTEYGDEEYYDPEYHVLANKGWVESFTEYVHALGKQWESVPRVSEKFDVQGVAALHGAFASALARSEVFVKVSFGDPSTVTANKDGSFNVEVYEHD